MTPLHQAMAATWLIACLAITAGLAIRRRWTLSRFFAAYIVFGALTIPMYLFWPDRFFRQWFYLIIQTVLDVLKFGIAIEVGWLTFRPFPAARSSALLIALVLLAITAGAAASVPIGPDAWEWDLVAGQFFPRIMTGTVWLMALTLILAFWYRVPVHPFHTAVLTSFVGYLGTSSVLTLLSFGATGAFVAYVSTLSAIEMTAEAVMRCYWVHVAWRPDTPSAIDHGERLRRLQVSVALPRGAS